MDEPATMVPPPGGPTVAVLGDLVEDVVVRLTGPPVTGTDTPAAISRSPGGSAANVAVAAASAGATTRFIGRVGADDLGARLVDGLAAAGVEPLVQRGGRTGTVVVLVEPGGERTMLPDRAAATELSALDPSWLDGVGWLHLPAYSLCAEPIGTSAVAAAGHVASRGGRVSVDVSSTAVVEAFGRNRFRDLLAGLAPAVVLATVEEAALLEGGTGTVGGHARPTGDVARPRDGWLLVVKDGARPVELRWPGGRRVQVPVRAVTRVVDSTGAGDAFAGGFIAATVAGAGAVEAVGRGADLAAATVTRPGARRA